MMWNDCTGQAFRYTDDGGAQPVTTQLALVGEPQTGSSGITNRATVVSDDGAVIAGFATRAMMDRSPAMWNANGDGVLLDDLTLDTPGEVLSINENGKVLAGTWGFDGFVWTKGTGMAKLVRFELALPSDPVFPNAMTADGSILFGGVGDAFSGIPIAFAWTAQGGMEPLADVAERAGVAVPAGTIFNSVLGASADGTVTIGTAMDADGNPKTFVLRVPASALRP
ncbi:MAG TPA: hypothetical protein VL463_36555 [Kofleriaceae bacterium]|nr:hypothetical protein [Kofleriaceae bacterium]